MLFRISRDKNKLFDVSRDELEMEIILNWL